MLFLRNRLFRQNLFSMGLILLTGGILISLFSLAGALGFLCGGVLIGGCAAFSQFQQYHQIAVVTEKVDRILHGEESLVVAQEEGELAILTNQIEKMTNRLREQSASLEKEKNHLANSLTDVAHQVRTPLTTLFLLTEQLRTPELADAEYRHIIREQEQLLKRVDILVTELLKIAKLEAGSVVYHPVQLTAGQLIHLTVEAFAIPLELADISLAIHGNLEDTLLVDPTWTVEALSNLLKNALEHTPEKGQIAITCQKNPIYSEIAITDSGPGISQEDLPFLFDRFYQGKRHHDASFGIGLALSRMIISQQNGSLTAKNVQKGGASFTVRFYQTEAVAMTNNRV